MSCLRDIFYFFGRNYSVLLTIGDVITDVMNGAQLISNYRDSTVLACGILTLMVMLLPGFAEGWVKYGIQQPLKIVLAMVTYPYRLIKYGVLSMRSTDIHSSMRSEFRDLKPYESVLEGSLQNVITMYIIMVLPKSATWVTITSVVFSVCSTLIGCSERATRYREHGEILIRWPGKLLAAFTGPVCFVISVIWYPTERSFSRFVSENNLSEKLETNIYWVLAILVVTNVPKLALLFSKNQSMYSKWEQLIFREEMREYREKVHGTLFQRKMADLFWMIENDTWKVLFRICTLISDLLLVSLNILGIWCTFTYSLETKYRFILSGCLVLNSTATLLDVLYIVQPRLFIQLDIVGSSLLELTDVLQAFQYEFYVTRDNKEGFANIRQTLYRLNSVLKKVFEVRKIECKYFKDTTLMDEDSILKDIEEIIVTLRKLNWSKDVNDNNTFIRVDRMLKDLDKICSKEMKNTADVVCFTEDLVRILQEMNSLESNMTNLNRDVIPVYYY